MKGFIHPRRFPASATSILS